MVTLAQRVRNRGGKWGIRSLRLNLALADADADTYVSDDELIAALKRYGLGTVTYEEVAAAFAAPGDVAADSATQVPSSSSGIGADKGGSSSFAAGAAGRGPPRLSVRDAMPHLRPASSATKHRPRLARVSVFTVMHTFTGLLPRARLQAISASYELLVQQFRGAPTVEQVCSAVGLDQHPDVVAGLVQLPDALFCFFSLWGAALTTSVSEDLFIQYFADWSPAFVHDEDFAAFLVRCFGKPSQDKKALRKKLAPSRAESDKLFESIDMNKNGTLSLAELDLAVIRYWPAMNYKPAVMRAYKLADSSGNGWLDKDEFHSFLHYLVIYVEYHELFRQIDTDKSGSVTLDELLANKDVVGLGELSDVQVRNIFKAIDTNNGGKVLLEEFCIYMARRNGDHELAKKTNFH